MDDALARRWAELAELLEAAKRTLPVAFREDGPPLGYVFDDPAGMEDDGMGEPSWLGQSWHWCRCRPAAASGAARWQCCNAVGFTTFDLCLQCAVQCNAPGVLHGLCSA